MTDLVPNPIEDVFSAFLGLRPMRNSKTDVVPFFNPTGNKLPIDLKRTDSGYTITADVPGFSKDDVDVELDGRILTITAHHESEEKTSDEKENVWCERKTYSHLQRSIKLDDSNIDAENIHAAMLNGVLTVTVPVTEKPEKESRKIEVSTD